VDLAEDDGRAELNPDTPGKLTAHAFSYEHMELAAYELLARVASAGAGSRGAALARTIGARERVMGERLAACFDTAVETVAASQSARATTTRSRSLRDRGRGATAAERIAGNWDAAIGATLAKLTVGRAS